MSMTLQPISELRIAYGKTVKPGATVTKPGRCIPTELGGSFTNDRTRRTKGNIAKTNATTITQKENSQTKISGSKCLSGRTGYLPPLRL